MIDVSFISLIKILPAAQGTLKDDGDVVALIKPQFEAGRRAVGKGGVVRDAGVHREVIQNLLAGAGALGWRPIASLIRRF